jgi:hypothetical protein
VEQVREVAQKNWGFRKLEIRASEVNRGLVCSITRGVTEVCQVHGEAIVLEDDIVPREGFLEFMNSALEKYREAAQVMQISAYAYPVSAKYNQHSLVPLISCWGWATWQRAWQQYGWNPDLGRADLDDPDFLRRFDLQGAYPYSRLLRDVLEGRSDSWGVIWYWNVFRASGLTLFPARTFVDNIGWDGTGEHAESQEVFGKAALEDRGVMPIWPRDFKISQEHFQQICGFIRCGQTTKKKRGILANLGKKFGLKLV